MPHGFKHGLTQEVAYNSLLIERRKKLHEQVGAAIEALYSSQLSDHLSELAHHYQRSGNIGKALEYLPRAAEQSIARSCHAEAVSLFTSALELTKALLETTEREQKELHLEIALGSALFAAKGWSYPEAGRAAGRAADISRRIGSTPHLFVALCHLVGFNFTRGKLSAACKFAEEALEIAEERQDPGFLVWAHCNRGLVSYAMGELISARTHLERAISLYDPTQQGSYRVVSPDLDPGPWSMGWAAWTLHLLGYADQALERIRQALALARELGTPFGVVHAVWFLPGLHSWRGEPQAALHSADELLRLTTDHGFEQMARAAPINRAIALIGLGRVKEGLVQLEDGFAAVQTLGAVLFFFFESLAIAYDKAGRTVDGLAAVDAGLAMYERTGEKVYQAALYTLRGELLLKLGTKEEEAQLCFRRALEIARRQQAKHRELKTTMSLARLLAKNSCREEARAMLADIYGWFTEGFDTADLKDAKALLEELSR
jgi:tetratricopeptide (TPR) repeat protein